MSDTGRKFYVKFGGNIDNTNFQTSERFRNSQMNIRYFNIFSNNQANTLFSDWSGEK